MNTTLSRRLVVWAFVAISATWSWAVEIKPPAADDFLAPLDGGPTNVEHPKQISLNNGSVTGATAQDAMNAAVKQNKQLLADAEGQAEEGTVAQLVKFPSGIGVIASGQAHYSDIGDTVLQRISQRHAYIAAFADAKQNLATYLHGLSHEAEEEIGRHTASIGAATGHLYNISERGNITIKHATEYLLRSFVIYEVADDPKAKKVVVSIATSPKTCQRISRTSATTVEVDSIRDGLNQLIAEVRLGVNFPVGCRIITVPATGETAVVGFGSQVVRTDAQAAVAARLRFAAQKAAAAFARDSLSGMVHGDRVAWEGRYSDRIHQEFADFEDVAKDALLAPTDPAQIKRLETRRQSVVAEARAVETNRGQRQGELPGGVQTKTWFDEEETWTFAVAVYLPSATQAVEAIAQRMQDSQWLAPRDAQPPQPKLPAGDSGAQPAANSKGPAATTPLKQGPTGRINSKDL